MVSGSMNVYEFELLFDFELEIYYCEVEVLVMVVVKVVDVLFGFGIVVVVFGIVIIMLQFNGDMLVIGEYIVGVLVGMFFGILLCYGFIGLLGLVMENCVQEDLCVFECVKVVFIVNLCGYNFKVVVEFVCKLLLVQVCLSFSDFEVYLKDGCVGVIW